MYSGAMSRAIPRLIIPVLATAGGGGGASLGVMRAVLNLFGAVSGGMYADTLYLNR